MPTQDELKEKIQLLKGAGLPYDDELKQLQALQGGDQAEAKPEPEKPKQPQAEPQELPDSFVVNEDAFQSGWGGFETPPVGIWLSEAAEADHFSTEKRDGVRYTFDIIDEKLSRKFKGSWFAGFDKDAGKHKYALEKLGLPFQVVNGQFYTDLSKVGGQKVYTSWVEGQKGGTVMDAIYTLDEQKPESVL